MIPRRDSMIRRPLWLLAALAAVLLMVAAPAHAQQTGAPKTYPAGWNLIALPPGTSLPATTLLYTLQPNDADYEALLPGGATVAGFGYWANLPSAGSGGFSRAITLAQGVPAAYSIPVPAGQWVMVGNPSGILPATIQGSDASYTFDPAHGYQAVTALQPGQGAFVTSTAGAVVTLTPRQPVAQTQPAGSSGISAPPVTPVSSVAGPVTLLQAIPLQTNPQTAVWPAPFWTWWPAPPLNAVPPPWTVSTPYSGPFLCPSDIITAFALIYCGMLSYGPP
jgi:hypothetical protein